MTASLSADPPTMSLSADRRARELADVAGGAPVDVLVIGLGVTGAGVALDAASRGLSVAAIDAHDLAFGTSRWSSKLVHGGLRYLAAGDVRLAHESAVERGILLTRTAPHLVRPLGFLLPLNGSVSRATAVTYRAAFAAAGALRVAAGTPASALPGARRVATSEARRLFPAVDPAGLRGGLLSWDGQLVDDARLVVALARTAAGHGARVLTRCRAVRLGAGGATVVDTLTGETGEIRARVTVNATGVWAGDLDPSVRLRPSRGTHLVLRAETLGHPAAALSLPVPGNRLVLALPQDDGRVYVGLTDEPLDGPADDVPRPSPAEVGYLLDTLNAALSVKLTDADVVGAFAGVRPLLAGGAMQTADLSRRHAVRVNDRVVTVVGGKLTTYRRMARDAVDAAVRAGGLTAGRCRTARLPLVGAGPAPKAPDRLVARYGTEASAVAALAAEDPALAAPVADGIPVTGAELRWAVRHEGALDVDDLLDRRTRIGLVPADRARALPAARAALGSR